MWNARGGRLWLEVLPSGEVTKSEVHFSVSTRSEIPADKALKGHFSNFMTRTEKKKTEKKLLPNVLQNSIMRNICKRKFMFS
jgi:hypothetical protein